MTALFNVLLIMLSMVGIADASYITYEEFADVSSFCQNIPGFDCGTVLSSEWAYIGPLPVSVLGILFYSTVFILAIYHLLIKQPHPLITRFFYLVAGSGFVFTLFLLYLQAVVIGAYCLYCMISAVTSTLIFLTAGGYYWSTRKKKDKETNDSTIE